jgi:sugar O-acyltransferase (sialic acid O-acetyltransferase NeuD family)
MERLIFLGARAVPELTELVRDINDAEHQYEMVGILDDEVSLHGTEVEGIPVTGGLDKVSDFPDARFVFSIGSFRNRIERYEILQRLGLADDRYATLIHPRAKVYCSATISCGSIIHCGAVVGNGARLGRWVIVLWNAVIGANNILGDGVLVTSNVTTNFSVNIGSYAFIGTASAIAENVTVNPGAMVSMTSLVLRDVEAGTTIFGNPPRTLSTDPVPDRVLKEWSDMVR